MYKKLLQHSSSILYYIFSISLFIPLFNLSYKNISRYNSFKDQNPQSKDIEEMDFIFDNLSSENVLLENGFVIAMDFHTYLRAKTTLEESLNKNIIFENLQNQNGLIYEPGSNKELSLIVSCRYSDCSKEIIKFQDIFVTYKKNQIKKDKKITIVCIAKNFDTQKLKNFKIYDCSLY